MNEGQTFQALFVKIEFWVWVWVLTFESRGGQKSTKFSLCCCYNTLKRAWITHLWCWVGCFYILMSLVEPPLNHFLSTSLPKFWLSSHYCQEPNKHLESPPPPRVSSVWPHISTREGAISQLTWSSFKQLFLWPSGPSVWFYQNRKFCFIPDSCVCFIPWMQILHLRKDFQAKYTQHFWREIQIIIPTLYLLFPTM